MKSGALLRPAAGRLAQRLVDGRPETNGQSETVQYWHLMKYYGQFGHKLHSMSLQR